MAITVNEFATIVEGEAFGFSSESSVGGYATDDREIKPGDLFLAIKGARADGHDFVPLAMARGAVGALVERPVSAPHVLVPNLVQALAKLALHFRNRFDGPVIGVTGSAGKTTAKEFIAAALSPLGTVLKTAGNRNTEFTVPLMWTELQDTTKAVVVEMSMRGFGQIKHLSSFSKPTIGVVTNIGFSHMSEVGSREGIAEAKAELLEALPSGGIAILWQEDPYLDMLRRKAPSKVITFGYSEEADCRIDRYHAASWTSSEIEIELNGERAAANLGAVGRHIALGAAAAIAAAGAAGVPLLEAASALQNAQLPPMRMEVTKLNGATVLLDTYNAAPPSMHAAIETFTELPCKGRRLAVIGEMRELGDYTEEAHRELGRVLAKSGIDEVIFYGDPTALSAEEARMHGMVVHQAGNLGDIREFLKRAASEDAVLVKGSRSLELEKGLEMVSEAGR